MLRLLRTLAPTIGLVPLFLTGCPPEDNPQDAKLRDQLRDREFLLQTSEGFAPVEGTGVRLRFQESSVSLNAGCNSQTGTYSFCDEHLCVTQISSTLVGCAQALHEQDVWLHEFLEGRPRVELEEPQLTLTLPTATLTFLDSEVADPDRPLIGRLWVVDTLFTGQTATNVSTEVDPTLRLDDDGSLEVFTTCGTGQGTYSVQGDELALESVAYAAEACDESGSSSTDEHIQSVLSEGRVTFTIDATRLTLVRDDLGISATTE